ncbi:MAG: hypothetical protein EPO02_13370 [Nitrospirae bacterium]|nr:MAG: hypothetical protein EPO02_13370 [Nitrospirota bacterium]
MEHEEWCEAEQGHEHDCKTATQMARLRALAESLQAEFTCHVEVEDQSEDHVDDCWHCAATEALEPPDRKVS